MEQVKGCRFGEVSVPSLEEPPCALESATRAHPAQKQQTYFLHRHLAILHLAILHLAISQMHFCPEGLSHRRIRTAVAGQS